MQSRWTHAAGTPKRLVRPTFHARYAQKSDADRLRQPFELGEAFARTDVTGAAPLDQLDGINAAVADLAFMHERWLLFQLGREFPLGEFGVRSPLAQQRT